MTDEEIIKEVLAGKKELFAEIVKRYQAMVMNICYREKLSQNDAEEIAQTVFVELYKALPRFKYNSKLSTFIYSITSYTRIREFKRQKNIIIEGDNTPIRASENRNIEQEIIYNEQIERLHNAIGKLKYEQRTALVLYTFNDFSYQQISDVMQCSLTKVEALIFRAKKNLRKIIDA